MLSGIKRFFAKVEVETVDTIVGDFHSIIDRLELAGQHAASTIADAEAEMQAAIEKRAKALAEKFRADTIARNVAGLFKVDAPTPQPAPTAAPAPAQAPVLAGVKHN